ncbi:MAG: hypothetical protein KA279_01805 [Neisseria sp.]|nr:hypothetical protein [Neisseria sp.]
MIDNGLCAQTKSPFKGLFVWAGWCAALRKWVCRKPSARLRRKGGFEYGKGRLKEKLQTACLSGCAFYARAMTVYTHHSKK